jgi:hypothetical protein
MQARRPALPQARTWEIQMPTANAKTAYSTAAMQVASASLSLASLAMFVTLILMVA